MTVKTYVFTDPDGWQHLVCIYPDGHATLAERHDDHATWGAPLRDDEWYRDIEPRPIEEVESILSDHFKEVRS